MISDLVITKLSPDDSSEAKYFFKKVWTHTYPNEHAGITFEDVDIFFTKQLTLENIEKFKQKIEQSRDGEHYYFSAKLNGKIVGIAEVSISNNHNKILIIAVDPDLQGRGIGFSLWNTLISVMNIELPIILDVAEYNQRAIRFYERLGFRKNGPLKQGDEFVLPSGKIVPEIEMILDRLH
jgi:ribosomal protein S18 acetylase RimI-like enzyme